MGANISLAAYADAEDKCPVDHKNMSKEELEGMMAKYKGHPKLNSRTDDSKEGGDDKNRSDTATGIDNPSAESAAHNAKKCPVDHKNMSKEQITAYMSSRKKESQAGNGGTTVYDVYGQELDRANLMPATPNQLPSPGQQQPLSTDRVKSTIPKAGEDGEETWTYPSPQMFYNALKRKGKADGVEESDMDNVVSIHNDMNEKTWREVMRWEQKFHCHECDNPKLKRFMGKPTELSPAARFRVWCRGYPMPFDRHDWIVDRCGLGEARYIIDYYYRDGPDPIEIHVRPAIDSLTAAFDRLQNRATFLRDSVLGNTEPHTRTPVPAQQQAETFSIRDSHGVQVVSGDYLEEKEFAFLSSLTPEGIEEIAADVQKRCTKVGEAFRDAGNDPAKIEQANIAVNYCMAQRICKPQATDFMSALESGGDEATAYDNMTSCLDRFHIVARRTLLEASGVAQSGPEFPAGEPPSVAQSHSPAAASRVDSVPA